MKINSPGLQRHWQAILSECVVPIKPISLFKAVPLHTECLPTQATIKQQWHVAAYEGKKQVLKCLAVFLLRNQVCFKDNRPCRISYYHTKGEKQMEPPALAQTSTQRCLKAGDFISPCSRRTVGFSCGRWREAKRKGRGGTWGRRFH